MYFQTDKKIHMCNNRSWNKNILIQLHVHVCHLPIIQTQRWLNFRQKLESSGQSHDLNCRTGTKFALKEYTLADFALKAANKVIQIWHEWYACTSKTSMNVVRIEVFNIVCIEVFNTLLYCCTTWNSNAN